MIEHDRSPLCLAAALLAVAVAAPAQNVQWHNRHKVFYEVDGRPVVVSIEGNTIKVRFDGEDIAAENIKGEGNRIEYFAGGRKVATVEHDSTWRSPREAYPYIAKVLGAVTEKRAQLGVRVGAVSSALAAQLGLDAKRCVIVVGVTEGQAADAAGVERHDIVTEIDGRKPVTQEILQAAVREKKPGETMRLRVLRRGASVTIAVKLGEGVVTRSRYGAGLLNGGLAEYSKSLYLLGRARPDARYDPAIEPYVFSARANRPIASSQPDEASRDRAAKTLAKIEAQLEAIRKQHAEIEKMIEKLAR